MIATVVKILDALLAEKPGKGRGRNLSRASLLGICSTILFLCYKQSDKLDTAASTIATIDKRLAKVEWAMGLASTSATSNADAGANRYSVSDNVRDLARVSGPHSHSLDASRSNRFSFAHK